MFHIRLPERCAAVAAELTAKVELLAPGGERFQTLKQAHRYPRSAKLSLRLFLCLQAELSESRYADVCGHSLALLSRWDINDTDSGSTIGDVHLRCKADGSFMLQTLGRWALLDVACSDILTCIQSSRCSQK